MSEKIFDGLKVVEFAWVYVGPATSKYLADHGATVVKIESHNRPGNLRLMPPFAEGKTGIDRSMFFGRTNSNKYSATLDLKHPKGIELAWKFIEWADIVTEAFAPGVMEKLGLDYENVKKKREDIIYLSTCMQGQWGPFAGYKGFGSLPAAFAGFFNMTGWPDEPPTAPHGAYVDYVAARFSAAALLGALEYRRRTGKGQWIDQSQYETSLHFMSPVLLDYSVNNRLQQRNGNRINNASPHGVYRCLGTDRWVAISILSEKDWTIFCEIIGKRELLENKKFETLLERKKNENELDKIVEEWTLNHSVEEIEQKLQSAGLPAHRVAKSSDVFDDPQLKHRKYFTRLDHPEMGKPAYEPQACFLQSRSPREVKKPSPCLGEHNEYVYKELLGLSDEQIAEHLIDGSITTQLPEWLFN